jgi:hypothetical protein
MARALHVAARMKLIFQFSSVGYLVALFAIGGCNDSQPAKSGNDMNGPGPDLNSSAARAPSVNANPDIKAPQMNGPSINANVDTQNRVDAGLRN